MPSFTVTAGNQRFSFVSAFVGVSAPLLEVLKRNDLHVPEMQRIVALIDTGASHSVLDPLVIKALGINPTGSTQVVTASSGTAPIPAFQYDVSFLVPGADSSIPPYVNSVIAVIESDLYAAQGFHMLIGMDIIKDWVLIVNGPMNQFTVSY